VDGPDHGGWRCWVGVRDGADYIDAANTLPRTIGLRCVNPLGTLTAAHDAFRDWGEAEGNTKSSAGKLLWMRAGAFTHFGLATLEFSGYASMAAGGLSAAMDAAGADVAESTEELKGQFSITEIGWRNYPEGMPRPAGPFRLLEGEEYAQARAAADATNKALHAKYPEFDGYQIHEWQPVKFGGSPTDIANKYPLTATEHQPLSRFWSGLQRRLTSPVGQ